MLNIAPALYGQSNKYIQVWLYIFTCIAKGEAVSVANIITECSVTRQSLYDILNRGVHVFNQHNIPLSINRSHAKDRFLIIDCNVAETPQKQSVSLIVQEAQKDKPINTKNEVAINVIVTYLNEVTNKAYRTNNASTIRLINARLNNGFTVEQFKYVIDIKASQWMNTEHEKYLRPETLFGNKFEGYLNETFTTNKPNDSLTAKFRNAEESINRDWGV